MFSVIMLRIAMGVSTEEGETALLVEPSANAGAIQLSVLDEDQKATTV